MPVVDREFPQTAACGPAVGYYGDDFTGAAANLLEFHRRGLRGRLFVRTPPLDGLLAQLAGLDVIGIAGIGRSLGPDAMADEVRPAFELLRALDCALVQYKICSTFDSSPTRGNFGVVLDLAREAFGDQAVAVLAAHPDFGRYTVFGEHFADYRGTVYRLDRHPSMSMHPSTPMDEADLRIHLGRQTAWPIASCDWQRLRAGEGAAALDGDRSRVVIFDALEHADLERVAAAVWSRRSARRSTFTLSSHGFAAGLAACMSVGRTQPPAQPQAAVDRMLVLSGSCSPQTATQIARAESSGWKTMRLALDRLADGGGAALVDEVASKAIETLDRGQSLVVYSATGPQDAAIARDRAGLERGGVESSAAIGRLYGDVLRRVRASVALPRFALAGGDTSSQTLRALGIEALAIDAINESSQEPFLRLHAGTTSDGHAFDGAQVLLKAGQNGPDDYFDAAQRGAGWV